MIQAKQVLQLTGLTANQLREWTHRRAFIAADVRPSGPGSLALYSWQTVLLLRLAVVLQERFRVELKPHHELFSALKDLLQGTSFLALRGSSLALYDMRRCELLAPRETLQPQAADAGVLILRLDPHLDILTTHFDPQEPSPQLPLFRAVQLR